jgi:hypothetical protein
MMPIMRLMMMMLIQVMMVIKYCCGAEDDHVAMIWNQVIGIQIMIRMLGRAK